MSQEISKWNRSEIGEKTLELILQAQYITMTGSVVNTDVEIPFPFRLMRVELKQVNSSEVDTSALVAFSIQYRRYAKLIEFYGGSATFISLSMSFEEIYKFLATTLRIALTGTNTNRIYPVLTVERL